MAEKQDIPMNNFASMTDAGYVYVEGNNGSQGKMKYRDVMVNGGIIKLYINIEPGDFYELPYTSGLIIIRDATSVLKSACAIIDRNNNGEILTTDNRINFFSDVANKICVFMDGKYIVKNTFSIQHAVSITMIGQ